MTAIDEAGTPVSPADYSEIQHFYARQMQLLDGGNPKGFAGTFTEDGELAHKPGEPALHGHTAILEEYDRFMATMPDGTVRRHWFTMVVADRIDASSVRARHYALVVTTSPGGPLRIGPSCVGHDVLVRDPGDGGWRVRSRRVEHDGAGHRAGDG